MTEHPNGHDGGVYVISAAAELTGVKPQTLRSYERHGLVHPARTGGGERRYSDQDLTRIARIAELTDQGVNLAGIAHILELEDRIRGLDHQLEQATRGTDRSAGDPSTVPAAPRGGEP
ncbi:MAG: helix-turn-helix transcriptional regulator [Actinomycetota bacterium]|nr:helix-turn-helix transcriptional regulator [Actinomycetota bacterium]